MEINFECINCRCIFDCDIGAVTLSEDSYSPCFEKKIMCPRCGERSMDEVFLTELGQSQLTEATLGFEADDIFDFEDDDSNSYGYYSGECQGCEIFQSLNDYGLCEACAGKLERDLIRQRDWAYSILAYGVPESKLEELRTDVIKQYGEKLELIAPTKVSKKKPKKKKRKKKRNRARR